MQLSEVAEKLDYYTNLFRAIGILDLFGLNFKIKYSLWEWEAIEVEILQEIDEKLVDAKWK